jgi:hypothetical protein
VSLYRPSLGVAFCNNTGRNLQTRVSSALGVSLRPNGLPYSHGVTDTHSFYSHEQQVRLAAILIVCSHAVLDGHRCKQLRPGQVPRSHSAVCSPSLKSSLSCQCKEKRWLRAETSLISWCLYRLPGLSNTLIEVKQYLGAPNGLRTLLPEHRDSVTCWTGCILGCGRQARRGAPSALPATPICALWTSSCRLPQRSTWLAGTA